AHGRVTIAVCFFFSSRRRHTRFSRDWSSDVCSSDLIIDAKSGLSGAGRKATLTTHYGEVNENVNPYGVAGHRHTPEIEQELAARSEERRVGKESGLRRRPDRELDGW